MLYNTENKRNFHHTKITRYTVSILKSIAIYKTNDTNYSVLNCYCNWHAIGHAHASHSHNYIAGYFEALHVYIFTDCSCMQLNISWILFSRIEVQMTTPYGLSIPEVNNNS